VQARDVMTREVVTVGPETSVKDAAAVLADRGFAALPVVDEEDRLLGTVAEADVLRDRLPQDPRLHLRRDDSSGSSTPPTLVRGVMTEKVRTVEVTPTSPTSHVSSSTPGYAPSRCSTAVGWWAS
jgi:CBS-domain-containing membrane protein